ncbi:MAG: type I-B CRISPR-associated protein Cas7/Cst2/DevR [Thermoplasmatales archaeon]
MNANCITFSTIVKMDLGNPNSGYNEDIISTIKKIQYPNGDSYPYISGQSLRRMVRERMKDLGFESSPKIEDSGKNKSPFSTSCDPVKYADDDLFGYMDARNGVSRTSPVRVSPAVALFPFNYERDLGIQNNADIHQNHRMYETEISSNWLSYSVLIEIDRIGNGESETKTGNNGSRWEIPVKERISRLEGLLQAFLYLWGGGKQSRLLTNQSPMVISISLQRVKNPVWIGRLHIDSEGNLDDSALEKIMQENSDIMRYSDVGVELSVIHSKRFTKSPKAVIDDINTKLQGIFNDFGR